MNNKELPIPDALLAAVNEFISGRMGIHFPDGRTKDLERGLRLAAHEFGFQDPEACAKWLISTPLEKNRIEVLAGCLTVGETYFFRDGKCFEFLEERVLPQLIEQRRHAGKYLRIWSAGCCTGEEPFSMAILLGKMFPAITDWKITILATDINPVFIRKASAGVYRDWSFRDGPKWIRERYFARTKGNCYEILPEIRKHVFFEYHNLAEDDYPSPFNNTNSMDLILCRNVLMYLTPGHQNHVIRKLRQCLVEGGWLIVSPSEAYDPLFSGFARVTFRGATFYRKGPEPEAGGVSSEERGRSVTAARACDALSSVKHLWTSKKNLPPKPAEERLRTQRPVDPYEQALALYEKGHYGKAMEELMDLLSDGSHEAKAAALLARILADQGRLSEAAAFCRRAVAADRCNPGHYYLLATILEEQGLIEDAATELRNTLYLDQDFVLAHFRLGNLFLRHGNRKKSAKHFRNAFKLLSGRPSEELVPGAEGLTAGRLKEMIQTNAFKDVP